jgi:hypothetical protein
MLGPFIFIPVLITVILYAYWRGGKDERLVATICWVGTLATLLSVSPVAMRYDGFELDLALVDLAVLFGFVVVAVRSERFWPLWVAGLQLTTAFGHGLKFLDSHLLPQAYGAALQFWSYPILAIIFVGTWRAHRRAILHSSARPLASAD